jgi:hypothetical protein
MVPAPARANTVHALDRSATVTFLDIIRPPDYFSKHIVSETGFCLRLQVNPTQLVPISGLVLSIGLN